MPVPTAFAMSSGLSAFMPQSHRSRAALFSVLPCLKRAASPRSGALGLNGDAHVAHITQCVLQSQHASSLFSSGHCGPEMLLKATQLERG